MLSRKGRTTDLEWRILKYRPCCVIPPGPILSAETSVPEKSKGAARARPLLLRSPDARPPEGLSLHQRDVRSPTAWEARCAAGRRGLRKPGLYFWPCHGPSVWWGERHSASPCPGLLSCLYSLHALQAEISLTVHGVECLLLLVSEGLWPLTPDGGWMKRQGGPPWFQRGIWLWTANTSALSCEK